jgi:hypothetical protein
VALTLGQLSNLFNGVSQQPPALRSPSQHEALENVICSLVDGLGKRAPTNHVKKLNSTVDAGAFVHIIDRDAEEKYVVVIRDGALAVYDLATGTAQTLTTPDGVGYLDCLTARTDYVALTIADHTFIVNRTVTVEMTGDVTGGTLQGQKQAYTNLTGVPTTNGHVWEITGDPDNAFDNFYVKGNGSLWVESTPVGISYKLDATTMPHKLVRNADSTWTFQKIAWDDRLVGDDESNPLPSFVGLEISDLFFYRNRLGFCAAESVVMSRAGDYYNLFARTVTAVLSDDPIDFNVSHSKISLIRHALPYSGALLLFSDKTQFQITAGDVLTPESAKANSTTEFEASPTCRPVGSGQDVYFPVERGQFTGIREYFVEEQSVTNNANDITAHVPKYIPNDVFRLCVSTSEDALVALSLQERNVMWVYKYHWAQGDSSLSTAKKLQSAWGRFSFDAADVILGGEFVGSKLYLVVQRSDGQHLEWMDLQNSAPDLELSDGESIVVHLDRKTSLTGVYSAGTGLTTWTLPYAETAEMSVVLSNDFVGRAGEKLNHTAASSTTLTAIGDYSGGEAFVGRNYTFEWELSEQFVRDENNTAALGGRLQLRQLSLLFHQTGYFTVEVTPPGGTAYTYVYTGKVLGSSTFVLGKPSVQTGEFRVPVLSDASKVSIIVKNDSYLPCHFQSAQWAGFFVARSRLP